MSRFRPVDIDVHIPFTLSPEAPDPVIEENVFFTEAWSISPTTSSIVGTVGYKVKSGKSLVSGHFHGFVRTLAPVTPARLRFKYAFGQVDFKAGEWVAPATSAVGINNSGDIVGFFRDERNLPRKELHGFIWWHGAPEPEVFDISDATFPDLDPTNTDQSPIHNAVFGINNDGVVVGVYHDANVKRDVGYIAAGGFGGRPNTFRAIDMNEVLRDPGILTTTVHAVNSNLDIVGSFSDRQGTYGFKWRVDSTFTPHLEPPTILDNSLYRPVNTEAYGINDNGVIVGNFDQHGNKYGFAWTPDGEGNYSQEGLKIIDIDSDLDANQTKRTWVNGIDANRNFVGAYRGVGPDGMPGRRAYESRFPACFIATAAYGSPLAEDVITLRTYRDTVLQKSNLGRRLLSVYYFLSPPLARLIEKREAYRALVRYLLAPAVIRAKKSVSRK